MFLPDCINFALTALKIKSKPPPITTTSKPKPKTTLKPQPTTPKPTTKKCPSGYENAYSSSLYCHKLHLRSVKYNEAKGLCKREGAQMLELTSSNEAKAVEKHFRNKNSNSFNAWLSLRKKQPKKGFLWLSGKPLSFKDWYNTWARSRKDCVYVNMGGYGSRLSRTEMKWVDSSCNMNRNFICMRKG